MGPSPKGLKALGLDLSPSDKTLGLDLSPSDKALGLDLSPTEYTEYIHVYRGNHLIGRLGSRHSVPFIRFYRLSDVNYTIRYEFVSKLRPD